MGYRWSKEVSFWDVLDGTLVLNPGYSVESFLFEVTVDYLALPNNCEEQLNFLEEVIQTLKGIQCDQLNFKLGCGGE